MLFFESAGGSYNIIRLMFIETMKDSPLFCAVLCVGGG